MIFGSYFGLNAPVWGQNQQVITPSPLSQETAIDDMVIVDVFYATDPPNTKSTGISFLMHFDSSKLEFDGLENVFQPDLITTSTPTPQIESEDKDGDLNTDRTINMGWLSFFSNAWPDSTEPTLLYRARFKQIGRLVDHTAIRFSTTQSPPGFEFTAVPAVIDNRVDVTMTSTMLVDEAATDGLFTILFSKLTPVEGSFTLAIEGTARGGVDFEPVATTLAVPMGVGSTVVPITLINDKRVEGDETITVTLTDIEGNFFRMAQPPDNQATITITDNDQSLVSLAATTMAKEDIVNGDFTLSLTNSVDNDVEVSFSIGGSAVEGSDYEEVERSLVIPANDLEVTLPISILSNDIVENEKSLVVTLMGTDHDRVLIGDSPHDSDVLTIDDDDASIVSVVTSMNATEAGEESGIFTISMTESAEFEVMIHYSVGGTATSDFDYAPLNGMISLSAGQKIVALPVFIIEDNKAEGDETLTLTLESTTHNQIHLADFPGNTSSLIIQDNDVATVGFNVDVSLVEEDAPSHPIEILLSVPEGIQIDNDITVDIVSSGGSADAQSDYNEINEGIVFSKGSIDGIKKEIELTIVHDEVVEGPETIVLELTSISGPSLISTTARIHTVTLSDFVLQLTKGWNLISIPYQPYDPIKTNFIDVAVGKIWSWNSEDRPSFRALENDEFLTMLHANWIYSRRNTSLLIPEQPSMDQNVAGELKGGWNLFGPTKEVESPYNEAIAGEIWYWDETRYRNIPRNGGEVLEVGKGYWIHSNGIQLYPHR